MSETNSYIIHKGWQSKREGDQIRVKYCPFCNDEKYHFYISNDTEGLYYCHKCDVKGNLWYLKKYMGDLEDGNRIKALKPKKVYRELNLDKAEKYHLAGLKHDIFSEYIKSRCIDIETAKKFKLGLGQDKDKRPFLTIPHYRKGKLVNIKKRILPPHEKTFLREPDCESILFNCDVIQKNHEIIITEGELDAITLIQAGIENVVSVTAGANAFHPEWVEELEKITKVYLCYDPDEKGQSGAYKVAKRLGFEKCYNVNMPDGYDINEFFCSGKDIFDFQALLRQAKKFDLPGIISIHSAIDQIIYNFDNPDTALKLDTPWKKVNKIVGPLRGGELIVLTAPPKTGKTTFALQLAKYNAWKGHQILFYCMEMTALMLAEKIIKMHMITPSFSKAETEEVKKDLIDHELYLNNSIRINTPAEVLEDIKRAVKRYDLKLVIFDHIHWLSRSMSNPNEEMANIMRDFKALAGEMGIPIIVLAQPRKKSGTESNKIMSADDVKGSNAIFSDCDQMIIMHRNRKVSDADYIESGSFEAKEESLSPITLIRSEANRHGSGGEVLLNYMGAMSRFEDLADNYGR